MVAAIKMHLVWLLYCYAQLADSFQPFKIGLPDDKPYGKQQRRNHWCDEEINFWQSRMEAGDNPRSRMPKALEGRHISVIMLESPNYIHYNESTNEITGGFLVEVFEELANRTGLSWHGTTAYSRMPDPNKGETYDGWIEWAMNRYDIVLGDFAATAELQELGMRFGYPFLNESPWLVAQVKVQKPSWYEAMFSWTRPFSLGLWSLIAIFFAFTAYVFAYLEPQKSILYKDENEDSTPYEHSLWLTIASFTCGEKFKPHTRPAKIFVLAWTFTVSLITASYTANLASLLVVSDKETAVISSVEDAIAKNLPICVWKGGAFDKFVRSRYPDLSIKYPREWGYHNVRNGNCAAILKDHTGFRIDQGTKRFNEHCDLQFIGKELAENFGSFLSKADSEEHCTDFVMDALSPAMHAMYTEGWLRQAKDDFYRQVHDISCDSLKQKSDSKSLTVDQTFGIFVLHIVISIICVVWHFMTRHKEGSLIRN
eukprot:TRINITY_DN20079_c0_g1_i1.p1 TRINITY_DN20079_c0_g1~~TRINITY_DN20079_c0_g1_i1.p1  ORF type:complete len:508 (+),score=73.15 TRINITY_DN20079_c0_g1_i1:78-1526(+)